MKETLGFFEVRDSPPHSPSLCEERGTGGEFNMQAIVYFSNYSSIAFYLYTFMFLLQFSNPSFADLLVGSISKTFL